MTNENNEIYNIISNHIHKLKVILNNFLLNNPKHILPNKFRNLISYFHLLKW